MTAATASISPAADQEAALAARLCWHAVQICQALDHGVAELQIALAEAADHTDAVIELALGLAACEPTTAGDRAVVDVARRLAVTSARPQGARS